MKGWGNWLVVAGFFCVSMLSAWTTEINVVANSGIQEMRRGCCSWHGGVCGCKGGRTLCCDGTLSPSCRCD
jgi:hypothetical protein